MSTMGTMTTDGPSKSGNGQGGSSTTEQAKDKVNEAAGQARGQVRQQIDQRSTEAGERVSSTAGDVRSVAQQLREQGKEQPAKLAEQAADRAEKVGDYLKQADADSIMRNVEDFGRKQPWAVMFGGLAAGFLASRFLKASSSRRYETAGPTARRYDSSGRPVQPVQRSLVPPRGTDAEVSLSAGVVPSSTPAVPSSTPAVPSSTPAVTRPGGAF